MSDELRLDLLPQLPQCATIREVSTRLWHHDQVLALWLGGSLARGSGDAYSDVDYRVALAPQHLPGWQPPDFATIFASATVVGQQALVSGQGPALYHLVLSSGEILDFWVQSTAQDPTPETRLVLGCRDERFARTLEHGSQGAPEWQQAQAASMQELLTAFWITTHKHRKVLHRRLDLMAHFGMAIEHSLLLRLWYISISGKDCGDLRRQTIHSLTDVIGALEQAAGDEARALVGAPHRLRHELYRAIENNRAFVARLGRSLAQTYGFPYPEELEATVQQSWQRFRAEQ